MRAADQSSKPADAVAHPRDPGGRRDVLPVGRLRALARLRAVLRRRVTDWLDGHFARRWEQQSELGRFLDPIADKLLVSATLFMLTATGRLSATPCCRRW
jgi:hypothetical protein